MISTFPEYLTALEREVHALSPGGRRRFAVWCARRLFVASHRALPNEDSRAAARRALDALDALPEDTAAEVDIDAVLLDLHAIDVSDIDTISSVGSGAVKLLECLEDALVLAETDDARFAVACAQCPIDVIDVVMTDELGLDTSDPSIHIGHPLLREEIDAQMNELRRLATRDADGTDR